MAYPFHDKNDKPFPLSSRFPVLLGIFSFSSFFTYNFDHLPHVFFLNFVDTFICTLGHWYCLLTFAARTLFATLLVQGRRLRTDKSLARVPTTLLPCGKGASHRQGRRK
jgi:hypothetical protein